VSGLAVITGGAGHLGRAVARRLGADGMAVALWDRDAAALERAAGELSAAGLRCRTACVDLTDAAAVAAAASALSGAGEGPVRVLVAAAGWSPKRAGARPATVDISAEEWRAVLEVNLTAVFHAVAGLIPGMAAAGGGRIVAISSTAGVTGSATDLATDQPQKQHHVGVAVDHRVKKRSKPCHSTGAPRDLSIDHVEDSSKQDNKTCPGEHSFSEQDGRKNINEESDQGQDIGMNLERSQEIDDRIQNPAADGSQDSTNGCISYQLSSALLIVEGSKPHDLEGSHARRNLHLDFIPFFLVEKALADR